MFRKRTVAERSALGLPIDTLQQSITSKEVDRILALVDACVPHYMDTWMQVDQRTFHWARREVNRTPDQCSIIRCWLVRMAPLTSTAW